MADAAAARREARRRRILENSHNRLQLISGKSAEDCSKGSPIKTITEPDSHRFCINNGVIVTEQESIETFPSISLISSLTSDVPVSDSEVVNDLAFSAPRVQETVDTPLLEKLITHKYDIAILSLIIQILYTFVLMTDTYFFLPVIMYSVTKMIYFPTKSNSNIENALMLLNNISSSNIQRVIIQTMHTLTFVLGDISIFLFTTICMQSLCNFVVDSLIT